MNVQQIKQKYSTFHNDAMQSDPKEKQNTVNYLKAVRENMVMAIARVINGVNGGNILPKNGTSIGKKIEAILKKM